MLPDWRIKITGMPTSNWLEAHMHLVGCSAGGVFSGYSSRKNTTEKKTSFSPFLWKGAGGMAAFTCGNGIPRGVTFL
jgi:hypothetical protein